MIIKNFTRNSVECGGRYIVALGVFDGVHIGHADVIGEAVRAAREMGAAAAAWCFDASSKNSSGVLCEPAEKEKLFSKLGLDTAFFEDFDNVRDMSPEEFVRSYLKELGCTGVMCGFNFSFGKGAVGNARLLESLCEKEGFFFSAREAVMLDGEIVSSTAVKEHLKNGDVEKASGMLGRDYSLASPVEHGRALGKELGFPTVNQYFENGKIVPKHGVYFTRTEINGICYPSVSNVGVRPTVGGHRCRLETHILDFDGDLYGASPEVFFEKFRREEITFANEKELASAIENDVAAARLYFAKRT